MITSFSKHWPKALPNRFFRSNHRLHRIKRHIHGLQKQQPDKFSRQIDKGLKNMYLEPFVGWTKTLSLFSTLVLSDHWSYQIHITPASWTLSIRLFKVLNGRLKDPSSMLARAIFTGRFFPQSSWCWPSNITIQGRISMLPNSNIKPWRNISPFHPLVVIMIFASQKCIVLTADKDCWSWNGWTEKTCTSGCGPVQSFSNPNRSRWKDVANGCGLFINSIFCRTALSWPTSI